MLQLDTVSNYAWACASTAGAAKPKGFQWVTNQTSRVAICILPFVRPSCMHACIHQEMHANTSISWWTQVLSCRSRSEAFRHLTVRLRVMNVSMDPRFHLMHTYFDSLLDSLLDSCAYHLMS